MKKNILFLMCAATLGFYGCNKAEKAETQTATTTDSYTTTDADAVDPEARYRDQASQVTKKMASDLQMEEDTETQQKAENAYFNRARRASEVRERHNVDTTGMHAELREINLETDQEFQSILAPEKFKLYKTKSYTYYKDLDDLNSASNVGTSGTQLSPGATITTKTDKDGDTKTEIEDGNTEIKIKRDADGETKIKTTTKK